MVGRQISFSLGYVPVTMENASTLLEITSFIVHKLSENYSLMSNVDLKKLTFTSGTV